MQIIDITIPLAEGVTTYPSVPPLRVKWLRRLSEGDTVSLSDISLVPHLGTHVDAPAHALADGDMVEAVDLQCLLGEAEVVDASGHRPVTREVLRQKLPGGISVDIVLLKTGYVNFAVGGGGFDADYAYMDEGAVDFLLGYGVRTVGVDTPNVDRYGDKTMRIHRRLLGAGIAVVENLWLQPASAGRYEFIGLPLRLRGVEAASMRAVLVRR